MRQPEAIGLEQRLADLEGKVRAMEDQLAIYQLLARYGPSVDSRSETSTASMWSADGIYDFGETPLRGNLAIGGLVNSEPHVSYVAKGSAHVMSMPLVLLDGESAVATGYSRLYVHREDDWKVERASANRWELAKTEDGWKVLNRQNRMLDGSSGGRELLSQGIGEG
ncbi:nuclear transport factor 2 family protein [Corticibacterium sp. UT-5YL-CI-8]|nr:nuclear transport factor 2 family protein [Tianweitania sp. UT-5YL-CI-8]